VSRLSSSELLDVLDTPFAPDVLGGELGSAVVVDLTDAADILEPSVVAAVHSLPVLVVGLTGEPDCPSRAAASLADVLLSPDDAEIGVVLECLEANPLAAISLALLLRASERRSVPDGLVAESVTYSMPQGGPEFARWRASRPPRERQGGREPPVRWSQKGSRLDIVLDRPAVHNAYDSAMRDGLIEALSVAASDDHLTEVHIAGEGPSFCSGGDLDEFGSRPDPGTAHLVRMTRNAARLMYQLSQRIVVHLHGACLGSGIELPAFAGTVVARSDTRIALPEVRLGLIPGAGGTVSLPRRIGRHRTAYLALSGSTIDVATATAWGLVDAIDDT
jgi:Enoyl-CoA hydratase/isomerase